MKKESNKRNEPLGEDEQIKALIGESIAEGESEGSSTVEGNKASESVAKAPKAVASKQTLKPNVSYLGKDLTIKQDGAIIKGLCTAERTTNSGKEVYIQLNALVSRFFNVENIVK